MLGFVQGCLNQDSRIDKLQKEEASYYEAWPIESCVLQILNQAQACKSI